MAPQRLGQHFLAGASWRERIARLALASAASPAVPANTKSVGGPPAHGGLWIEIGAGHGEMTSLLARQARRLIAIELDPRLLPRLREQTAALPNVTVVAGDILTLDLAQLAAYERFRVYGNLPYYITSPIVHCLLEHAGLLDSALLVVQLEVAARIAARPGSRDYGYLSAFTQFHAAAEILLRIPPGAFQPPPKVQSALLALRPPGERKVLGIEDEPAFMDFLKVCFAHKRKTLRNNLRAAVTQEEAGAVLRECGLAESARAEEIGLPKFARLFTAIGTRRNNLQPRQNKLRKEESR